MNTYLRMGEHLSWDKMDDIRSSIVDMLYDNGILNDVFSYDREMIIIGTSEWEHQVICENIAVMSLSLDSEPLWVQEGMRLYLLAENRLYDDSGGKLNDRAIWTEKRPSDVK